MESNKQIIVDKIREYLLHQNIEKISLLEIANLIGEKLSTLTELAETPEQFAQMILNAEISALNSILNDESYRSELAIDSLILTGQEVYENFHLINPAYTIILKKTHPKIYQDFLNKKIQLLKDHMQQNINKGLEAGEYKTDIQPNETIKKYAQKIEQYHSASPLSSEHYTFATVFNNIIEEFIQEVATEENWHYFRKRKQLIEVFHFGK